MLLDRVYHIHSHMSLASADKPDRSAARSTAHGNSHKNYTGSTADGGKQRPAGARLAADVVAAATAATAAGSRAGSRRPRLPQQGHVQGRGYRGYRSSVTCRVAATAAGRRAGLRLPRLPQQRHGGAVDDAIGRGRTVARAEVVSPQDVLRCDRVEPVGGGPHVGGMTCCRVCRRRSGVGFFRAVH